MKKLIFCFTCLILISVSSFAQTPIKDIQFTDNPSGDSPLAGQVVTIKGVVVAEHQGRVKANGGLSTSYFFVMDAAEPWSGIQIYYKDSTAAEGDLVSITGTVSEYRNQTQIGSVTEFVRHSTRNPLPGPLVVTTFEAATEAYECCLVQVQNVKVVETGIGQYNDWRVDDGSGALKIDTRAAFYYKPVVDAPIKALTGIVLSSSDQYSLAPRLAWDVEEGGEFTRIQRIQQVRNSDLKLALYDEYSDTSYAVNDTVKIRGVVTMPTGLSYAGAGIKFIMSEIGGGPWSGILSYHPDSTAYPTLFEGDLIEMTGYIGEYRTGPSNMTEFWITSPIDIVGLGEELPPADTVKTGDLRLPETAEQWGNCMVVVRDAKVVDVNLQYELYAVDDGSGRVLVDDDSDSLVVYYANNPLPPLGMNAKSMRGWIYHHYGSYADTSAYKLEPLYMSDIIWGFGPPIIKNPTRNLAAPKSTEDVTVSAEISAMLPLEEVAVYYEVLQNGRSTGYTKVEMSQKRGNIFAGTIPKQAAGSFVNYYLAARDEQGQTSLAPADTAVQNFCYIVKDEPITIKDIQYTPWGLADSPFEGFPVAVTGVVTVDTAVYNKYAAYSLQDAAGAWNGIFAWNLKGALNRGDEVTVYGTVTDYNADWHFKWDNNTLILTDSFKVVSSGKTIEPVDVTTGMLAVNSSEVEAYEGVLVRINNATLVAVNQYDASFDDGSGVCLIDADFMLARDQDQNDIFYINQSGGYVVAFGDTLRPGDRVDKIQGVFTFSFGTYKIEIRDANDFGNLSGVDPDFTAAPLTYKLEQNYPNPFNPETRIYFEIPTSQEVTLVVYNILGQKVRTLVKQPIEPGRHIVNWDGRNEKGQVVPSGLYFYRIKAGDYLASKRMLLLK